ADVLPEVGIVRARVAAFGHRIFHRLPLADQVEHHHRMGQEGHERREDAERDVTPDVRARRRSEPDDGRGDDPEDADDDRGEKRLSHDGQNTTPSAFVARWIRTVASALPEPRRALDVAMGGGRPTPVLSPRGVRTFRVGANLEAVRGGVALAASEGLIVRGWCADLTRSPLPRGRFELVVVARYLQPTCSTRSATRSCRAAWRSTRRSRQRSGRLARARD